MQSGQFRAVAPAKISSVLDELVQALDSKKLRSRPAKNCVILCSGTSGAETAETFLETLCLVNPSRFFIVAANPEVQEIATSVSARCTMLSKNEGSCSEIIKIQAPSRPEAALSSIILAHLLTGVKTELILAGPGVEEEVVREILPLADALLLDSAHFTGRMDFLAKLARECREVADLEWLRLSSWRELINAAFSGAEARKIIRGISAVNITAAFPGQFSYPQQGLLLGGWILHALHLEPQSFGSAGFECLGPEQQRLLLSFSPSAAKVLGVQEVCFSWAHSAQSVRLLRTSHYEAFISMGSTAHLTRPAAEEGQEALLKRYYALGESTRNYADALREALDLDSLRKGFL